MVVCDTRRRRWRRVSMNDMADVLKVITQLCHLFLSCLASCPTLSFFPISVHLSGFVIVLLIQIMIFSYHSNTPHNSPIYDEWQTYKNDKTDESTFSRGHCSLIHGTVKQVKPGFTNYQPRGFKLSKTCYKSEN